MLTQFPSSEVPSSTDNSQQRNRFFFADRTQTNVYIEDSEAINHGEDTVKEDHSSDGDAESESSQPRERFFFADRPDTEVFIEDSEAVNPGVAKATEATSSDGDAESESSQPRDRFFFANRAETEVFIEDSEAVTDNVNGNNVAANDPQSKDEPMLAVTANVTVKVEPVNYESMDLSQIRDVLFNGGAEQDKVRQVCTTCARHVFYLLFVCRELATTMATSAKQRQFQLTTSTLTLPQKQPLT